MRQFTKQRFFTLAFSLGVITLTALFVTSCSRNGNSRSAAAGGSPQTAELRYGMITEPVTFDPLSPANTADGRSILFNVFEGLVKPDSSGALVPALAERYRIEPDGLTYVFTLRPGVLFHNGEALRPEDVVFSLNAAMAANFTGFSQIAGIGISPSGEILITLKGRDPEFLPYLTVGIVPENNTDRERNPIGTGPFVIESYSPQQSLVLAKNPNYWQADLPKLDRVTIVFVADTDRLLTGLRGGNIDGAANITGSLVNQFDPNEFDILPWYSNMVHLMALNNAREPLNDVRVRQAVNYALDIKGIIETAFYGEGEPSGSPLIPGLTNVYNETLRDPYPRDIDRAKRLLTEAGLPNGFSLEITVPSNYTMHVDTAQVIVSQLADAGIRGTIRLVDWATWLSEVYRGRQYEATVISLDATNVSPRSFLARYLSGSDGNFLNFADPEYDRVYNAVLAEYDESRRNSLYREAQRIISEDAAAVYIQDILGFRVFTQGRYGGVINYPIYVIDFAAMYRK